METERGINILLFPVTPSLLGGVYINYEMRTMICVNQWTEGKIM